MRPSLDEVVDRAAALADDLDAVIARAPAGPTRGVERRVEVLRAQVVTLRGMDPDAVGFLPERLTWSKGQSVAIVLPLALRRLKSAGLVESADVTRCVDQAIALAEVLHRYETA